eukprot:gene17068-35350_t
MAMVIAAGFGASLSLVTMVPAFLPKAKFQELRQGFLYVMQHPALTAVADAARGSPLPLALFALVVAGAVALTVRLLDRTFVSGLQTIGSSSTRRRRTADHRWISSSGPAGVRKEFRLITRSPLLVLQLLPMVFLLAPLAFLLPKIGGLPLLPPVALFVASIFSFLLGEKKKTASVAKERLQIILAHERNGRSASEPDYLPALQRELVAVISKYIKINPDDIKVQLDRQDNLDVLEVKIELPDRK